MIVSKKSIILLFIVSGIIFFNSPAYGDLSYLEQVYENYSLEKSSHWKLGDNITEGDYYKYKICNDSTILQIIYPYHCYVINLEFITILESYTGKVWVVQGNFTIGDTIDNTILYNTLGTIDDTSESMIFLIDVNTFKVYSDTIHKELGASIQNTIFSLSQYGVQSLSIGTIWDKIDSYFTNKIPLEIKNKQSILVPVNSLNGTLVTNLETSVLSYDIIVQSNIYLHKSFPFPLKAVLYSPNIIYPHPKELYYFELLDYSNYYSNQYSREFENFSENNTIPENWEYSN